MKYIPSGSKTLLAELNIKDENELFSSIPAEVNREQKIQIGEALDEWQIKKEFENAANESFRGLSFAGYGHYSHQIPEVVNHLSGLRNFVTSYTPYQPELAQGTLQALYEYQSLMSDLTSMDIANASLYDGATSLVESIRMAIRNIKSKEQIKVFISKGIHPKTLEVVETYFPEDIQEGLNIRIEYLMLDSKTGHTQWDNDPEAVVAFQNPNYMGVVEDLSNIEAKALLYGTTDPLFFTLEKTPAEVGASIVWGEAQSLGMPISYGGPGLGFIAAKSEYIRQMPGRLVGKTTGKDSHGDETEAYVITLATREQHIRREKATSNICSNQTLMAVRAAMYMSAVGWKGMQKAAYQSYENAAYFQKEMEKRGSKTLFPQAKYFHEIPWTLKDASRCAEACFENNIHPGVILSDHGHKAGVILSAFNDTHTKEQIDQFIEIVTPFLE